MPLTRPLHSDISPEPMNYTTSANEPPYPAVEVRITDRGWKTPLKYGAFEALLDTGASFTCVPEDKVPPTAKTVTRKRPVTLADGSTTVREFVVVRDAVLEVFDKSGNRVKTFSGTGMHLLMIKRGLLGRDLLNGCVCTFDGPAQSFDIR